MRTPGVIAYMGGTGEAKIEMWGHDTERHTDISIYLSRPPVGRDQPWDQWVPDIVVEVVSSSSVKRDYEQKPKDYLAAGVHEYWIVDPLKESGLFLVRHVDAWVENRLGVRGKWKTARLPGFTLDMAKVLGKPASRK